VMPPSGRRDTFIGRTQHGLETVHILGQPNPGGARNRYVPDILKIQQHLSLSVTVPLAEAIRRTGAAAQAAMSLNEPKGAPQPG